MSRALSAPPIIIMAGGNVGRWEICLRPWWWWRFHRCTCTLKLTEVYIVNTYSFLLVERKKKRMQVTGSQTSRNFPRLPLPPTWHHLYEPISTWDADSDTRCPHLIGYQKEKMNSHMWKCLELQEIHTYYDVMSEALSPSNLHKHTLTFQSCFPNL